MNRLVVAVGAPFAVLVGLALVAAGCSSNSNGQNSLKPAGRNAQWINDLFIPIVWIAAVIGVLVVGRDRGLRDQVPPPRGQEREPEADPRLAPRSRSAGRSSRR